MPVELVNHPRAIDSDKPDAQFRKTHQRIRLHQIMASSKHKPVFAHTFMTYLLSSKVDTCNLNRKAQAKASQRTGPFLCGTILPHRDASAVRERRYPVHSLTASLCKFIFKLRYWFRAQHNLDRTVRFNSILKVRSYKSIQFQALQLKNSNLHLYKIANTGRPCAVKLVYTNTYWTIVETAIFSLYDQLLLQVNGRLSHNSTR